MDSAKTGVSELAESNLEIFCRQVRKRSSENRKARALLHRNALTGSVVSILRQELDSMVRCIFLLSIADNEYRMKLLADSVSGKLWRTKDDKSRVTDREMVDLANRLHGWTRNVYAFGCGFIHLSALHDYADRDPLAQLAPQDRKEIALYLRNYHGVAMDEDTTFRDIEAVLPAVFEKISSNLECELQDLERGAALVEDE